MTIVCKLMQKTAKFVVENISQLITYIIFILTPYIFTISFLFRLTYEFRNYVTTLQPIHRQCKLDQFIFYQHYQS
jgi:hypothetical protein